jgi:hypothetical protein
MASPCLASPYQPADPFCNTSGSRWLRSTSIQPTEDRNWPKGNDGEAMIFFEKTQKTFAFHFIKNKGRVSCYNPPKRPWFWKDKQRLKLSGHPRWAAGGHAGPTRQLWTKGQLRLWPWRRHCGRMVQLHVRQWSKTICNAKYLTATSVLVATLMV